jgi:hypothetical protein
MPVKLNLSEALFIPPEADQYVEIVLNYWDFAFARSDSEDLEPPEPTPEVEKAEQILDEQYPHVASAVDRAIIARSLKRDLHGN